MDDFKAPPDPAWQATTSRDLRAAYDLIWRNHPGVVPELGDHAFVQRLEDAFSVAKRRARTVDSPAGYTAVLAGFATELGDKHIWSRPQLVLNQPYWTGGIIAKQGKGWVIVASDQAGGSPREGMRLLECDGVPANQLAERNLGGFRATWRIEAQQYQAAPWLLVDEGNPFVQRPKTCVFSTSKGEEVIKLHWKRVKREDLLPKLRAAGGGGAAGFGIRQVGTGYWIALQDMFDGGAAVASEVELRQAELRSAPFVVVDVRGNGGGSSDVGTRIARALWNASPELLAGEDDDCGDDLRASPGNIADMEFLLKTLGSTFSPEYRTILEAQISESHDALRSGRAFSHPPVCKQGRPLLHDEVKPRVINSAVAGPSVILLTDNLCFSACLVLTKEFRVLGAMHVGRTTDAATHYTQVREQYLPSGFSLFSTLQSVSPGEPADVGPYEPTLQYDGNIADTGAVERWVLDQALPRLRKSESN